MQIKFGGFAAFCITVVIVGGMVSCVEAVCNRSTRKTKSEE